MSLMSPPPRRPKPPRTPVPEKKEPPLTTPAHRCDADSACSRAQFEVIVIVRNVAKVLYFCGHHFRKHRMTIFMHGYEVHEI